MDFLTTRQTAEKLPYPELADEIRAVALAAPGEVHAPPRLALPLPGGSVLLVMPASDAEIAITKLVTVHPGNSGLGLPTVQGEVVVMEAATGTRLGVLDGATVTVRRTAALSMLAARVFAPIPDGPLLIVGAGAQGRSHLEAFRESLGVSEVFIHSRTPESAESLGNHARTLGMEVRIVSAPEEALDETPLIVTATTSRTPVLPNEGVRDDAFVAAVGSFEPEAAELPAELVARSAVVVDTLEGAREEAGDLIQAHEAGLFDWSDATSLSDALRWTQRPQAPVVFESVGCALWDLAAARTAFPRGTRTSR